MSLASRRDIVSAVADGQGRFYWGWESVAEAHGSGLIRPRYEGPNYEDPSDWELTELGRSLYEETAKKKKVAKAKAKIKRRARGEAMTGLGLKRTRSGGWE